MRLLLDTHIILWLLDADPKLSNAAKELMLQIPSHHISYSVVSLWEIGIKRGVGRLQWSPTAVGKAMSDSGASRLQLADAHIERISTLPHHHRDPFDRMLIAQAECEPMRLLTSDSKLAVYGPLITLV